MERRQIKVKAHNLFNSRWLIAATIFTAAVIFLTHLPNESVPEPFRQGGLDKLMHIAAYGMITFFFVFSLRTPLTLIGCLVLSPAIITIGVIDEVTQPLVHRTASLFDWLANVVGIVIVLILCAGFRRGPPDQDRTPST